MKTYLALVFCGLGSLMAMLAIWCAFWAYRVYATVLIALTVLAFAACALLAGCARTWQPFSDDELGRAKAAAYESCMAHEWLQSKAAEERCLGVARGVR